MSSLPRVCVIGAGSSGITVCKSLQDKGIEFDCYEAGSEVGGNWRFGNDNKMSNIYKSLHINTHRDRMEYRDYPMPKSYADYPGHKKILEYFIDYVNHFGFRKRIHFKNPVVEADYQEDGTWLITTGDGKRKYYDALVVCNGHHWSQKWPDPPFPGKFTGKIIHSHSYVDPENPIKLTGKRVVVLGMGNSAMDIAVELCRPGVAAKVFLAARRGAYVIPNYLFGKPLDKSTELIPVHTPFWLKSFIMSLVLRFGVGKMEDFGLQKPDHKPGAAHPTISQDILVRLGRGDVIPKPNIESYNGNKVKFTDGTEEEIDAVIYCTGYNVKFPFFREGLISAKDNHLPLFHRMIKPEFKNLFFVGLYQPLGAIMPLAEFQGKWIAEYLTGNYRMPSVEEMNRSIEKYEAKMKKRYVTSSRHTMQVDFEDFLFDMKSEFKRGSKRAKKSGSIPNVEAIAKHKPVAKNGTAVSKNGAKKKAAAFAKI
ncbi:NAD(P)/FAD-dependent oxidoreductase [Leptospira gomenensis]|uniref:Flavin-containing monooxygenase 5 n=1 Tax=Leptospira gomenensis TaxID=2484974 RepID=A0A5F1Z1L1_9LEPT|nr:NAD(P)-binding domain-containing protein [Leptospira gomenensis]TGK27919.1 NAD(P)/FAD-dependent oxidoreductase [Leptospira gomenensis]TGK45475.1 NAD(P)/FAD-dependent oxidoreductase [Leptospira gomenensis]TGK45862.1 NAD(P)/FAD-dependent oxidoreductase [Leptospira gomenensis]TGK65212.1 NAD(P)/FAD-dependent oxidoreductase [Leptospira gomenensis]